MIFIYRLAPFGFGVLAGYFLRDMLEPAVPGSAVPVLDVCRNIDHVAGMQFSGFFAPFLIPALSVNADEELSAAFVSVMDVPVVAAAGLKRDVEGRDLLHRK